MADDRAIARYRHWYRKLLRFYPKPHRERFAEGMVQTFNDLCRERAKAGQGLFGFALGVFVETSAGIIREHIRSITMQSLKRRMIVWAAVVALIMLVPLLARWNWRLPDFIIWSAILFSAALMYELIARKGGTTAYRVAIGIACATGFVLLFINAAAGIIGDGPVNLMYVGVLAVGFVGALVARFQPRGMAWALFATAVAQLLVPTIALAMWKAGWQEPFLNPNSPHPPFHPGVGPVFGLNAVFAAIWIASGLLFRHAGNPPSNFPREKRPTGAGRAEVAG